MHVKAAGKLEGCLQSTGATPVLTKHSHPSDNPDELFHERPELNDPKTMLD